MTGIEDDPTLPDGEQPLFDDDPTLPDGERPLFDGDAAELPRVLGGRYTLEEHIGSGAGAVVWRAFDEGLARTVAVKVLRPEVARRPRAVARLRREAATAGRAAHPGIVAVYDTGVEDDVAWLALEHVPGPTLLDVLRRHHTGLPPQAAAAIAEQTAVALGHAHRRGLVHRDVKPANLLLTADGVVKLADFGVAATADDDQPPELAGTRGYAAPEQLAGTDGADAPPVDVFALGVVLHECLTGRPAFGGDRRSAALLAPRQVRPDVPRDLDAVVRRATAADPADRYPDGAAMAAALRPLVASEPFDIVADLLRDRPTARRGATTTARTGMDWRWVAVALAVLLTVAGFTTLAVSGGERPDEGPAAVADIGLPVARVDLFDPYGSLGAGSEPPTAAVDARPETVWRTPTYPVPLRSLGTPGLGIWFDLGAATPVDEVTIDLATGGITLELLSADAPPTGRTTEADWSSLARVVRPGDTAILPADGTSARYWLVWITELEPVGETWQAAIQDIRFRTP